LPSNLVTSFVESDRSREGIEILILPDMVGVFVPAGTTLNAVL
jgi:hypothetical protein